QGRRRLPGGVGAVRRSRRRGAVLQREVTPGRTGRPEADGEAELPAGRRRFRRARERLEGTGEGRRPGPGRPPEGPRRGEVGGTQAADGSAPERGGIPPRLAGSAAAGAGSRGAGGVGHPRGETTPRSAGEGRRGGTAHRAGEIGPGPAEPPRQRTALM